jgi:ribonuclease P protein component
VRKEETLRGRGSFQLLYRSGRRIDGEVLRCFFRWESGAGTPVRAGFSVSARKYNAVKRNRARRLMRAAFDLEREGLAGAAEKAGGALSVLFVYNGGKEMNHARFVFESVRGEMSSICGKICTASGRERR